MKKSLKRDIFDGHKRKNMVEYKETFLDEMKEPFLYFIKFTKNR